MSCVFVYVDRTNDGRAFYVGVGTSARLKKHERNAYWRNIAQKYGWTPEFREVVLVTSDRTLAFDNEIELISSLKTYHFDEVDWGANFTRGGEGARGRHPTSLSSSRYVKKVGPHGNLGKRRSEEWRRAHSESGNAMFGRKHSAEWLAEKRVSSQGERNPRSVLTWPKIIEIRNMHATGEYSLNELAAYAGVKKPAIFKIVHFMTWKTPNLEDKEPQ